MGHGDLSTVQQTLDQPDMYTCRRQVYFRASRLLEVGPTGMRWFGSTRTHCGQKMGELDVAMSDDVIRPAESSPSSIFKQGSVQVFVKQATDIKLFDRKTNRWNWSSLHGLCGEASQAVSQCLRMNLEDDHRWYLLRLSRPALVFLFFLQNFVLFWSQIWLLANLRTFWCNFTFTGLNSVVKYQNRQI